MTQMESPKRKLQKKNNYQRHKLFRKIKRRRKAQAEAEQHVAEKQLRKKLKLPKFDKGDDFKMVYLRDIVGHDPETGEDILKTGERVNRRLQTVNVNPRDLSKIDAAERNQELRDLRQYMGNDAFNKYMSDLQTKKDIQNAQYQKTWQGEAADAIDGGMTALAFNPETQPAADVYFALKGAKELFENSGYKYGLHQGVPNNGNWKIIDVSPQNLGYDSFGNLRTIDVMPDRLFNSGKDIHIKKSKRGTFTKAAKQHGMSVQGFANKVLKNPSKYSAAMRKKANFAHNASKWNK